MPDENQFHRLFHRYYPRVYSFFRRKSFPVEDSKDLTQIVFLRLHMGMKDYRREAEWGYVRTIAERVGLNELRYQSAKSRSGVTISLDWPESSDPEISSLDPASPAATAEDELLSVEESKRTEELSAKLHQAIGELPPRMRRCMQMRIVGGLKYREIADALGITIDTVKRLIFEAKRKLGEKLAG